MMRVLAETYSGYLKRLHALDVKILGEGAFSVVYQHPKDPDIVVKVVRADAMYRNYTKFCLASPYNPWVPQVHHFETLSFRDTKKAYVVFMEKLRHVEPGTLSTFKHSLEKEFGVKLTSRLTWFTQAGWGKIAANTKDKNFAALADYLSTTKRLDLVHNNVMCRGHQLVFTDPVA